MIRLENNQTQFWLLFYEAKYETEECYDGSNGVCRQRVFFFFFFFGKKDFNHHCMPAYAYT